MGKNITDGFTDRGYIEAMPGLYPALKFRYRLMPVPDSSELFEQTSKLKARQADALSAKVVAGQLVDWDLVDADGDSVPISGPNLICPNGKRAMPRLLFNRLLNIVTGLGPTDIDPEWADPESNGHLEAQVEAMKEDKPVGMAVDEVRVKN